MRPLLVRIGVRGMGGGWRADKDVGVGKERRAVRVLGNASQGEWQTSAGVDDLSSKTGSGGGGRRDVRLATG